MEEIDIIRRICNMILTNPQKMIREEDLKTVCSNLDFEEVMQGLYEFIKCGIYSY